MHEVANKYTYKKHPHTHSGMIKHNTLVEDTNLSRPTHIKRPGGKSKSLNKYFLTPYQVYMNYIFDMSDPIGSCDVDFEDSNTLKVENVNVLYQ